MGLFKSKEEKRNESEREQTIENLCRFTGSLSEYNLFMEKNHIIMDTGIPEKFVFIDKGNIDRDLLQDLIDKGCTGMIRYVPTESTSYEGHIGGYGIPVKEK